MRDCAGCDGFFLFANGGARGFIPNSASGRAGRRFFAPVHQDSAFCAEPVPHAYARGPGPFSAGEKQARERRRFPAGGRRPAHVLPGAVHAGKRLLPAGLDAYAVARLSGGCLTLYDVFSPVPCPWSASSAVSARRLRAEFAFTPQDRTGLTEYEYTDEDTYFFLCGEPLQQDMGTILSFPDLAHA